MRRRVCCGIYDAYAALCHQGTLKLCRALARTHTLAYNYKIRSWPKLFLAIKIADSRGEAEGCRADCTLGFFLFFGMPDVGQLRGHKRGTGPTQSRPGQNAIHAKAEPQKLFIECFQFEWFRFRTKTNANANTNTNTQTESASAIECVSGQVVGVGAG